jgi:CHAD domain-containing protein
MNVRPSYETLWRKRLDALDSAWPDFLAGESKALHKARVASRRIREALPVVAATAPPQKVKKLRRKVRSLTRDLGPIRELDVELVMLQTETTTAGVPASVLSLVRRDVASRRQTLRERFDSDPPVANLRKLLKKLGRVAGGRKRTKSKQPRKRDDQVWRAALATTLLRRAKRLKLVLEEAGPLYAPERIHAVRISTKKLRYALEIARDVGEDSAKNLLRDLKREQVRLGRLHDLQLLLARVRDVETAPGVGSRLNGLTAFADSLERQCRELHAEFVVHRDDMFEVVRQVHSALVPLLTTAHLRQARVASARRPSRIAKRA